MTTLTKQTLTTNDRECTRGRVYRSGVRGHMRSLSLLHSGSNLFCIIQFLRFKSYVLSSGEPLHVSTTLKHVNIIVILKHNIYFLVLCSDQKNAPSAPSQDSTIFEKLEKGLEKQKYHRYVPTPFTIKCSRIEFD